jgi:PTS system cellobiose-specific IIA component
MDNEKIIFSIIMYAGNAKANAYDAINEAKLGNFDNAEVLLKEASDEIVKAHNIQNSIITKEASGENIDLTLLLVHAEDHLMNAISARDYSVEIIELYKRIV